MQIIPAILEQTLPDIQRQVDKLRPFSRLLHLDILDGQFAPFWSWNDPTSLSMIEGDVQFEVHLMVMDPASVAEEWVNDPRVERLIIHAEATDQLKDTVHFLANLDRDIGLAVNPGTDTLITEPYWPLLEAVQVMTVTPGRQGQPFLERQVEQVRRLKEQRGANHFAIAVDGGINDQTAQLAIHAGADRLVCGRFLAGAADPREPWERLQAAIE